MTKGINFLAENCKRHGLEEKSKRKNGIGCQRGISSNKNDFKSESRPLT